MDLGLERVFRVHQALVQSTYNATIVHVAGSNGKGTLCATLTAHLHQLDQSTVLFTSRIWSESKNAFALTAVLSPRNN